MLVEGEPLAPQSKLYLAAYYVLKTFFYFSLLLYKTETLQNNCLSKSFQLLDKECIYKHEFQRLAMMLPMNTKEVFLASILMMKYQVKLKQTWMAEIKLKVLNHPTEKNADEDMCFFLTRDQ